MSNTWRRALFVPIRLVDGSPAALTTGSHRGSVPVTLATCLSGTQRQRTEPSAVRHRRRENVYQIASNAHPVPSNRKQLNTALLCNTARSAVTSSAETANDLRYSAEHRLFDTNNASTGILRAGFTTPRVVPGPRPEARGKQPSSDRLAANPPPLDRDDPGRRTQPRTLRGATGVRPCYPSSAAAESSVPQQSTSPMKKLSNFAKRCASSQMSLLTHIHTARTRPPRPPAPSCRAANPERRGGTDE